MPSPSDVTAYLLEETPVALLGPVIAERMADTLCQLRFEYNDKSLEHWEARVFENTPSFSELADETWKFGLAYILF